MSASNPTALPRTRSVSPFRLGSPPQKAHSPAPSSPASSTSDDSYEPTPEPRARAFSDGRSTLPPEPPRTGRSRSRTRVGGRTFETFRPGRAASPQPNRAERIKVAGQEFIATSTFVGGIGAWLLAGMPLIFSLFVAWLVFLVARTAFDFVASIYLD